MKVGKEKKGTNIYKPNKVFKFTRLNCLYKVRSIKIKTDLFESHTQKVKLYSLEFKTYHFKNIH